MFGLIKKTFMELLTSIISASNHTKCVSLSNQKFEVQLLLLSYILINTITNYTCIHLRLN